MKPIVYAYTAEKKNFVCNKKEKNALHQQAHVIHLSVLSRRTRKTCCNNVTYCIPIIVRFDMYYIVQLYRDENKAVTLLQVVFGKRVFHL